MGDEVKRVMMLVGHKGIWSGSSFQMVWALKSMKEAGVEVLGVWAKGTEEDEATLNTFYPLNIPIMTIEMSSLPSPRAVLTLVRVIREFAPQVIEAVKSPAQYLALSASLIIKRPALVFYRGISRVMDPFQAWKFRLSMVNKVIVNSYALRTSLIADNGISPEKVEVVYGEYDPRCNEVEREDPTLLREKLRIPQDRPLITLVGNYAPWRGQEVAIKAARLLKQEGLQFTMFLCGKGTESLQGLVKEWELEENVRVEPFRYDALLLLRASDLAINSSTQNESLSGALLNAQRLGVPCVATDVGGAKEIVREGETGFIVPPGDERALAEAIKRILTMPSHKREIMSREARLNAMVCFSPEKRLKKRLEVYEKVLKDIQPFHL